MSEKKRGRPKTGLEVRDAEIRFFVTGEDAAFFAEFANDLGFKSRSELWTAIAERLRLGGLSPAVFFKIGWQLKKRADEVGISKGAGWYNPFEPLPPLPVEDKPRPAPPLPDEAITERELTLAFKEMKKELLHR